MDGFVALVSLAPNDYRFANGEAGMESQYRPGAIVAARGRQWIVLPQREPDVLRLRPLTTAQGEEVVCFCRLKAIGCGQRVSLIPSR
jgi:hypothetical protein